MDLNSSFRDAQPLEIPTEPKSFVAGMMISDGMFQRRQFVPRRP